MTPEEARARWVEALRSGEFKQSTGRLGRKGHSGRTRYCCLGVACVLFAEEAGVEVEWDCGELHALGGEEHEPGDNAICLPDEIVRLLGLGSNVGTFSGGGGSLAEANDNDASFDEIADLIESGKVKTC